MVDYYLLSTDHEIIIYVDATDGHAQDFAVNGDFPLLILQAFAQYIRLLHAIPNQSSSPTYNQHSHALHQTRPLTPQPRVSFRGQWSVPTQYQQLKINNRGNNKYFMLKTDET